MALKGTAMRFDVVTLFPEFFRSLTDCGITARARQRGLWSLQTWNPRDVTEDLHRTVDDRPFGGGPGMILMAEPLAQTVDAKSENALIPKLTIQPLIENAVHYGMESGDDVCHIRLAVTLQDKELCIRVSNTGSQFPDNFFEALQKKQYTARGFGIGLLNIDQRLRINFGQPYRIRFYNEDDWAIVEMHIPYLPFKEDA